MPTRRSARNRVVGILARRQGLGSVARSRGPRRVARPPGRLPRLDQHLQRLARVERRDVGRAGHEDVARLHETTAAELDLAPQVDDVRAQPPVRDQPIGPVEQRRGPVGLTGVPRGRGRGGEPPAPGLGVRGSAPRPVPGRRPPARARCGAGRAPRPSRARRRCPRRDPPPRPPGATSARRSSRRRRGRRPARGASRGARRDDRPWRIAERTSGWRTSIRASRTDDEAGALRGLERVAVDACRGATRASPAPADRSPRPRRARAPSAPAAGSRRTRSRNSRSTFGGQRKLRGSGSSPASCAADSAFGSSTSASAFPPDCSTSIRWTAGATAPSAPPGDHRGRGLAVQPVEHELGHAAGVEAALLAVPSREQHDDALGVEPARDEQQGARRRGVEPLRVVDEAQHRPLLGKLGQQREARRRRSGTGPRPPARPARAHPAAPRPGAAAGGPPRRRAGRISWCRPANGSSDSDSTPRAASTCMPDARARASSNSAVLPTPGSPRSTSAALREPLAASSSPRMSLRSRSASAEHGAMLRRGGGRDRRFCRDIGRGPAG